MDTDASLAIYESGQSQPVVPAYFSHLILRLNFGGTCRPLPLIHPVRESETGRAVVCLVAPADQTLLDGRGLPFLAALVHLLAASTAPAFVNPHRVFSFRRLPLGREARYFFTTPFAWTMALASEPPRDMTLSTTCRHWRCLFEVFALRVCRRASLFFQGIFFSKKKRAERLVRSFGPRQIPNSWGAGSRSGFRNRVYSVLHSYCQGKTATPRFSPLPFPE